MARNRERDARMIELGLMTEHGQIAIDVAKAKGDLAGPIADSGGQSRDGPRQHADRQQLHDMDADPQVRVGAHVVKVAA
jgi:hypothetical protein